VATNQPASREEQETLHDVQVSSFQDASIEQVLAMLALSESRLESMGLVLAGVAHDINNLLTVLSGFGMVLHRHLTGNHLAEMAAKGLIEASGQMASLTRILSSLASKAPMTAEPIDVNGVLASMERIVHHLAGDNIDVEMRLHPGTGRVRMVPGQLERVLLNLALNARDAMRSTGVLRIEARAARIAPEEAAEKNIIPGDYVSIIVADNGCGIDRKTLAHIFEPHFSTKEHEGAGHGLPTVRRIVRECRGDVFAESQPGQGSTFEILLPRIPEHSDLNAIQPTTIVGV
jgi:signal transduction histidine kinase